jgi:hypothetical protein
MAEGPHNEPFFYLYDTIQLAESGWLVSALIRSPTLRTLRVGDLMKALTNQPESAIWTRFGTSPLRKRHHVFAL